ncbi:MAG: thiamine diphosphokinase, partial [Bacteroidetes bacterium]|nr:thiamine diphosphokinase [Bacteroidota bacterium]
MKKCIIIANGKCPKKSELKYFVEQGYSTIICADGGANSALKLKINPDYIIGDLDSIEGST